MLTTRKLHMCTSSPYFYEVAPSTEHHYENMDPDSFGYPVSCSFYQSRVGRAYPPRLPSPLPLHPDSPLSCSSSSSSLNSSSPSSEHRPVHRFNAEKMTDCDCRESAAISQNEGHQLRADLVTDMTHNGTIHQSSMESAESTWALTSMHDSSQLRVEPRNGFVCFIGQDATSCELVLRCSQGDCTIDGRQAVLVYANGAFHLKDLNSSYGTYVNERRVPSRCFVQLNKHDNVRFGFSDGVYRLQQITGDTSASSVDESTPGRTAQFETRPNAGTTSSSNTGPMNKLLGLKSRKSVASKTKSKEDVSSGKGPSKLSPSTSSLMSSASSNSSSSSATSPSSVFLSAMKMMKNRFKRKSSKDKSLVCSGNDDITFIRYDSQCDMENAQSASAPQSPSQPLSRMFRSHTYLDSCTERDLSPMLMADASAKSRCEFPHVLLEVEHDYDEVPREETPPALPVALHLPPFADNPGTADDLENDATSTPESLVRESETDADDLDDILAANGEDIYGHVDAYDEFESCTAPTENFTGALPPDDQLLEKFEPHQTVVDLSPCSSVLVLPHLNSEDRLNNNSSLDTLLTQSILVKSNCPQEYLEDCAEPDFQLLSESTTAEDELSEKKSEQENALLEIVDLATIHQSSHRTSKLNEASMKERSGIDGFVCAYASSLYPHDDGNYHLWGESPPEEESSALHRLSLLCTTFPDDRSTCDLESRLREENGSWSEEESPKETSDDNEYDIDDIGHLRRHPTAAGAACQPASEQQMTDSHSRDERDMFWTTTRIEKTPLSPETGKGCDESDKKSDQSRRAIGGLAFVINFDQDKNASKGKSLEKPFAGAPLVAGHRRLHPKAVDKLPTPVTVTGEPDLARQASCRRLRNALPAKLPATVPAPAIITAKPTGDEEVNNESDGTTTVKSPSRNRDTLKDAATRRSATGETIRQATLTPSKPASSSHLMGEVKGATVPSNWPEGTAPVLSNGTMKKSKVPAQTEAKDTASRMSSGSNRRSVRGGQLSESAVYLINRMFEDSDYHLGSGCCAEGGQSYGNGPQSFAQGHGLYPSLSHQSMSSSRSASPYSANQNASSPYICNSSTSTRMEYDESLSSLHSNSDSAQRMARLQSMTTVVQSSQSTLEKQVDSAIDEDGDLIVDDISEAGTYTVEIDDDRLRHRKKSSCDTDAETMEKSENTRFNEHCIVSESVNTEYEEDADCEVEENEEEEEEEEDQLEMVGRKIDELFNVYSSRKSKEHLQLESAVISGHSPVNHSTFTRPKRSPLANVSTDEEEETAAHTCATSDECLPTLAASQQEKNFAKKRISNELMSALKKINSKLEKTAKLGNISLEKPKAKAGSAPSKQMPSNLPTYSSAVAGKFSKTRSAPVTPLLLENRKIFRYNKPAAVASSQAPRLTGHRKNSSVTSTSSVDDLDDQSSAVSADTYVRSRSESVNSNASNNSSMRFNRAFALRRARLGMDTCGVEISEQAASKAKESQAKASPKKLVPQAFRRNDGGRFSLRTPSVQSSPSRTTRQPTNVQSSPARQAPLVTTSRPAAQTRIQVSSASKSMATKTRTSYSTSASVCSSAESLAPLKVPGVASSVRSLRKRSSTNATPTISKPVAHSDNELTHDGESSCEETQSLFTRFGRSSLRHSATSSTPWLQSLKANAAAKQRTYTPDVASVTFNSPIQKSSSFSSNVPSKGYSTRGGYAPCESYENGNTEGTAPDCVRSIPSFQMGKRFFSTKPHQMAKFDREFSSVTRCSSAAANGNNKTKLQSDPNLMTHSATESLLSRHTVSTSPGVTTADLGSCRVEGGPVAGASATVTPPINTGINARIFSISPLDSLVISAINQLSSKLRTRMRDLLERERSNHLLGSETRGLIEEILPQVGPSAIGMDGRSGQSKNAYSHEPSNISRDLSNILKNLKKVEQIFDVFYMVLEPGLNCHEVSNDTNSAMSNCQGIVTHASDSSDTSEGQVAILRPRSAVPLHTVSRATSSHLSRQSAQNGRPFPPLSPPSPASPPTSRNSGGGFFIEI